jgi:hypothetical protein
MQHKDILKTLVVQKDQLDKTADRLVDITEEVKKVSEVEKDNCGALNGIDRQVSEMFGELGIDRNSLDLEKVKPAVQLSEIEISKIENNIVRFDPLETIEFDNWNSYSKRVDQYINNNEIDISIDPIYYLLSKKQFDEIENKYEQQFIKEKWDKWDYIFVGAAGVLASLTDFFLVRIPKTINTGQYAGQNGSPITEWLKKYNIGEKGENGFVRNDWFAEWARKLEKSCKVPYDSTAASINDEYEKIKGMSGRTHRLQTLGHDPILGFIFGVLDIMRGTITGFSYDHLSGNHSPMQGQVFSYMKGQGPGLIEAILKHIGHLISDVATPAGLPAPFMALFQGINVGSFGEKERTIGQVARWMYTQGYDFRHFLVSGITPAVVEIVLRAYIMIRHYCENGETPIMVSSTPKYRNMLLFGHAIAAAGNVGKIALYQGNPLAINFAEWYALTRYLMPCLKYYLFERKKELENFYMKRWEEILLDSNKLYCDPALFNLKMVELGSK